jgi:uncharacterized protein YegL
MRAVVLFVAIVIAAFVAPMMMPGQLATTGASDRLAPSQSQGPLKTDPVSCSGSVTTQLSADRVRLCESAVVTSSTRAQCARCLGGIDVIVVEPLLTHALVQHWMIPDALGVVDMLARHQGWSPRVGVVHFLEDSARTAQDLTYDLDAARGPIRASRQATGNQRGQTHLNGDHRGAARQAMAMFDRAASKLPVDAPPPCRVVVYLAMVAEFTDPEARANIEEYRGVIRQLQNAGVTVFTGCPAPNTRGYCDVPRSVVGPRFYRLVGGTGALANMVESELSTLIGVGDESSARLLHVLSSGLEYVSGSGSLPSPRATTQSGQTHLSWTLAATGAHLAQITTFAVRPLAEGAWPITGTLTITTASGASIIVPAQPVTLTVSGLCETSTPPPRPTATGSPTATATPLAQPTPTRRPTATATPAPAPRSLYLPLGLKEHCDPEHKRADVALVIDTSSSMAGSKLEDAKAAAAAFVAQMELAPGRDQVAVVRFDAEAEVACELTAGRAVVEAAIRNLTSRSGTHMDKGLRTALAELQSPRHLERNMSVMILLTDGVQTGTPGEELRAAAEVRSAGVRLYAIGLGADVDAAALREMAGDDSRYHFAPDSADLAQIYAEIASDILCPGPAGGFWPGG